MREVQRMQLRAIVHRFRLTYWLMTRDIHNDETSRPCSVLVARKSQKYITQRCIRHKLCVRCHAVECTPPWHWNSMTFSLHVGDGIIRSCAGVTVHDRAIKCHWQVPGVETIFDYGELHPIWLSALSHLSGHYVIIVESINAILVEIRTSGWRGCNT